MALIYVNKCTLLFLAIFFLQTWRIIRAASIYYRDYNSQDILGTDINDYLDYNQQNTKKLDHKTCCNNQQFNYAATQCISKSTTPKPAMITSSPPPKKPASEAASKQQANDIIEHVITVLKYMREHAIALLTGMNILEADILSSSALSSLDVLCRNLTFLGATTGDMDGKVMYPDVLYRAPGYLSNEWSKPPIKSNVLAEVPKANEFVDEAPETVKTLKKQIENCKNMLDNAVHNALLKNSLGEKVNTHELEKKKTKRILKVTDNSNNNNDDNSYENLEVSPFGNDEKEKQDKIGIDREPLQKLFDSKKHKYYSIYNALRSKDEDY